MLEQLRDVLKALKWPDYDTTVYATLVEKGAMSPSDIVYATDVPSGRVYDVLKSLEKRGAIIEIKNKPKVFDAQNPRMVLNSELDELEKRVDKALISAEQSWEKRSISLANYDESAWTVRGDRGIVTQLREIMQNVDKSLIICDEDINWLGKRDHKIIKKIARSNKKVKILSSPAFSETLEDMNSYGVETRTKENISPYYIIDESLILLKFGNPPSGVVVHNETFVKRILNDFERDFKVAKKVLAKEFVS